LGGSRGVTKEGRVPERNAVNRSSRKGNCPASKRCFLWRCLFITWKGPPTTSSLCHLH
jgi:hypothetical protein